MTSFPILTDGDVYSSFEYEWVLEAMREAFVERAAGTLEAPPRWRVDAGEGELVFTAGAATGAVNAAGFRVYETFPETGADHTALVAVFDATTGAFEGLLAGYAVGGLRTGGIGGVAVDALAPDDAQTLGVLGSGFQARSQVGAACTARSFSDVQVYSPTPEHRDSFATKLDDEGDPSVRALEDAEPVVREADALLCATDSTGPVFDPDWLEAGTHVTTIGPKYRDAHELPPAVLERADAIATDSLPQLEAGDRPSLLSNDQLDRTVELAEVLESPDCGRDGADEITLFCSVGLAGTEVVLGKRLLAELA
ncbi:ornithine cyclodeaminase family protein [Salinadaptatus halalkaliphilus]|uniref:Ornithine cyclodeaminase family protein n=1 Tax=Salinadaptatus halalkaliphilus TaxID=2419781 RepID=A0A4S3TNB0_9EURY|nr:ornithine cyclodeaminase family protein [Salinadaptatus halalkaliphilus]THE65752.1 ornithine cyclodeaminase family protein [Salinadaptatus halalkaliphilus]